MIFWAFCYKLVLKNAKSMSQNRHPDWWVQHVHPQAHPQKSVSKDRVKKWMETCRFRGPRPRRVSLPDAFLDHCFFRHIWAILGLPPTDTLSHSRKQWKSTIFPRGTPRDFYAKTLKIIDLHTLAHSRTFLHILTHSHTFAHSHIHTHSHTRTFIHTRTFTHSHTHTLADHP